MSSSSSSGTVHPVSGSSNNGSSSKYLYFWHGPLGQWDASPFTVDGVKYSNGEQYMMAGKARLFGDKEVECKIMSTSEGRKLKKLGRQVKGFDEATWIKHRYDIVLKGNMAKFSQNEALKEMLLESGSSILVEASPFDQIWGIGLDEQQAKATPPNQWPGMNLLGKVLMEVRETLRKEEGKNGAASSA